MRNPTSMNVLARLCAFRAGWQVYHAGRHEDYDGLIPEARAGYEAARSGLFENVDTAYDAWLASRNHGLRVIVGGKRS